MTAAARFSAASGERAPPVSSPSSRRLPSETTSRERRAVSRDAWPSSAILTNTTLRASGRAPKIRTSATSRARNVAKKRRGKRSATTRGRRAGEEERNEDDERRLSRCHGGPRHRERRFGRSRESGETRGDRADVHAPQPVRSRDGLDGFPGPAGAAQDLVGHLDALAARSRRPAGGVPFQPLDGDAVRHVARGDGRQQRIPVGLARPGHVPELCRERRGNRGRRDEVGGAAPRPDHAERRHRRAERAPDRERVAELGKALVGAPRPERAGKVVALRALPRREPRLEGWRGDAALPAPHGLRPRRRRRLLARAPRRRRSPRPRGGGVRPRAPPRREASPLARTNTAVAARDRRSVLRRRAGPSGERERERDGRERETRSVKRRPGGGEGGRESAQSQRAPRRARFASSRRFREKRRDASAAGRERRGDPSAARKSGRPRRDEAHRVEETRRDESGAAPEETGRDGEGDREKDARGVRPAGALARSPASARAKTSAARPVRNTSAGVAKSPRSGAGSHPTANTPEAPSGVPSRRANRAATTPAAGRPAANPRATARSARTSAGLKALARRTSSSATSGSDASTESASRRSRLSEAATRSLRRVGPSLSREELDEVGPEDSRRIAPRDDERPARSPLAARRHPAEEDARDVKGRDEPRRRRAALGLEPGGLARPRDRAARAVEEDRAPARAFRERLPEDREEPRGTHLRAAAVRDRREFPPGVNPFGRSAQRLAVPLESLLRRAEEELVLRASRRGGAHRREARGERQGERDERRGEQAENDGPARAQRRRSQGRQRAIGIRIP